MISLPHRIIASALLVVSSTAPGSFAASTFSQTEAARPVAFPLTISYNLEKNKVTLPSDFAAANNLLILSYTPGQQKDAESWLPAAKDIVAARSDFRFYMLPVFARQNILYRLWMNYSMRSESPTSEYWRWIIPLYVNKEHFDGDLEIRSESEIAVLLVDKAGKVLWRTSGSLTSEKKSALLAGMATPAAKAQAH